MELALISLFSQLSLENLVVSMEGLMDPANRVEVWDFDPGRKVGISGKLTALHNYNYIGV